NQLPPVTPITYTTSWDTTVAAVDEEFCVDLRVVIRVCASSLSIVRCAASAARREFRLACVFDKPSDCIEMPRHLCIDGVGESVGLCLFAQPLAERAQTLRLLSGLINSLSQLLVACGSAAGESGHSATVEEGLVGSHFWSYC
ncbi:hypothetical protein, partial [Algiphilus sp.]|uniref:hypothetical protein n=1 Tax=Algiphilus sp. TaxID=1872431 RepID=UPI003C62C122